MPSPSMDVKISFTLMLTRRARRCGVALGFLDGDLVASLAHLVAYPAGDVLRCGVEIEDVVEIAVIQLVVDQFLDVGEIVDHAVLVQGLGPAVYGHDPVVAVQPLAFAVVVEREVVRA